MKEKILLKCCLCHHPVSKNAACCPNCGEPDFTGSTVKRDFESISLTTEIDSVLPVAMHIREANNLKSHWIGVRMVKTFVQTLKKTFDFNGRSRRKELLVFFIFFFPICVGWLILALMSFELTDWIAVNYGLNLRFLSYCFYICGIIVWIGMSFSGIGLIVRRLHDTGRSGFWYFIGLLCAPILWVLLSLDSKKETNEWGESPKYPKGYVDE